MYNIIIETIFLFSLTAFFVMKEDQIRVFIVKCLISLEIMNENDLILADPNLAGEDLSIYNEYGVDSIIN